MAKSQSDPLQRLKKLTTPLGIYQHSKIEYPDQSFGYALEDQARALIVAHHFKERSLEKIYLNFINKAQRPDDLLYQYYYEDIGFLDNGSADSTAASQEAYGITIWALLDIKKTDRKWGIIVNNLLKDASKWTSPRAISAALLGLTNLNKPDPIEKKLSQTLQDLFKKSSDKDWPWFENYLVYANPILPWSLWRVAQQRKCQKSLKIAEKSTIFLINTCQINGLPAPIGNLGWFQKGGQKALYDQQPIDAGYMVCCLEQAYLATKNKYYLTWAKKWWRWFWGENSQRKSLINENFACFDGLNPQGVNLNQGAESNICFLLAYLAAGRLKIL